MTQPLQLPLKVETLSQGLEDGHHEVYVRDASDHMLLVARSWQSADTRAKLIAWVNLINAAPDVAATLEAAGLAHHVAAGHTLSTQAMSTCPDRTCQRVMAGLARLAEAGVRP